LLNGRVYSPPYQIEVRAEFGITRAVVGRIEQEGMNKEWPPLDEAD
jgi:hypothetical protein